MLTAVVLMGALLAGACGGSSGGSAGGGSGSGGGGSSEPAGEPILIGAVTPVTGAGSLYGGAMQKTMELAVKEVNEAGGVLGRPLRVYFEDGATDPDAGVRAAKKLIDVNHVVAILGTWSSAVTLAVAPLAIEAGIIEMNTSGSPSISDLDDHGLVLRTHAHNVMFGKVAADAAVKRGYKTAALMVNNNPATIAIADQFTQNFERQGGQVVAKVQYNPEQTSYRSEIRQALAAKPDLVLLASYTPDAIVIVKEGFEEGAEVAWMGPGFALNQQFVDAVGAQLAENVIMIDPVPSVGSTAYKRLEELYRNATGNDVFEVPYAVETFDQIELLALAIQKAGTTDGSAVAKALIEVSGPPGTKVSSFAEGLELLKNGEDIDYEGASSSIDFDDKGDVKADFGVFEIHDGKFEQVDTVKY